MEKAELRYPRIEISESFNMSSSDHVDQADLAGRAEYEVFLGAHPT